MKIDITQILAIFGAFTSFILLLLRFRDRADKKRKVLVRIDRFSIMDQDTYNYHNGRKGNQFIRIRITNKSENPNVIEKVDLYSSSVFLGFCFNVKKVPLTFDHDFSLPFRLDFSDLGTGYIYIHMNPSEFHKSWKSNFKVLKELHQNHLLVRVYDSQNKKYQSNKIKLSKMLDEFLEKEKNITTTVYFENEYNKTSS
jgi:hypothetical protein